MSEYQYYEFQAIDRPLTDRQMATLRSYSSRATITSSRFVNEYSFGSFKGDPAEWMDKYFDAFLYLANWGTHELMLRLPRRALDLETAQRYLKGQAASARGKGDFVVLTFLSEEDEGGSGWLDDDEGRGWMSSVVPIRAELATGDLRALYLGWLFAVQLQDLDVDAPEPPVPAGLDHLDAPLKAFAEFLRIDEDLISVAAERSAAAISNKGSDREFEGWVRALPESEKSDFLARLAVEQGPHLRAELLRRFRSSRPDVSAAAARPRTAGELLAEAERRADNRRRRAAEHAARKENRRLQEAAAERARYLVDLAKREPAAWKKVGTLISTKKPADYDQAVKILGDLRDLGIQRGRAAEVLSRIQLLREEHAKKPSFLERLRRADLVASAAQ